MQIDEQKKIPMHKQPFFSFLFLALPNIIESDFRINYRVFSTHHCNMLTHMHIMSMCAPSVWKLCIEQYGKRVNLFRYAYCVISLVIMNRRFSCVIIAVSNRLWKEERRVFNCLRTFFGDFISSSLFLGVVSDM